MLVHRATRPFDSASLNHTMGTFYKTTPIVSIFHQTSKTDVLFHYSVSKSSVMQRKKLLGGTMVLPEIVHERGAFVDHKRLEHLSTCHLGNFPITNICQHVIFVGYLDIR